MFLPKAASRLRHDQRGTALVEFAFVFPVFIVMLLGIVEFGRAIWTNYSLQSALADTTRYILANPTATDGQITTYVGDRLPMIDTTPMTVSVVREAVSGVNFVTVSAQYPFSTFTSLFDIDSLTLVSRSRVPLTD